LTHRPGGERDASRAKGKKGGDRGREFALACPLSFFIKGGEKKKGKKKRARMGQEDGVTTESSL